MLVSFSIFGILDMLNFFKQVLNSAALSHSKFSIGNTTFSASVYSFQILTLPSLSSLTNRGPPFLKGHSRRSGETEQTVTVPNVGSGVRFKSHLPTPTRRNFDRDGQYRTLSEQGLGRRRLCA